MLSPQGAKVRLMRIILPEGSCQCNVDFILLLSCFCGKVCSNFGATWPIVSGSYKDRSCRLSVCLDNGATNRKFRGAGKLRTRGPMTFARSNTRRASSTLACNCWLSPTRGSRSALSFSSGEQVTENLSHSLASDRSLPEASNPIKINKY